MTEAHPIAILTVDHMPEGCTEVLGVVTAAYVTSKPLVGDMIANLKNWTVGGELQGYTRMLENALKKLSELMSERAAGLGATAVIGFRISTTSISSGAAELIGYGTAVR